MKCGWSADSLESTQSSALQFSIRKTAQQQKRVERKWRLRLTAMCGLTAISCSIIYIIIKFVLLSGSRTPSVACMEAPMWGKIKLVSTWSINCWLHVWCSCAWLLLVVGCWCCCSSHTLRERRNNKALNQLTFSCLKKHSIFSSLKTRFDDTSDWNTLGSFLSATRRPSRGSVTALQLNNKNSN